MSNSISNGNNHMGANQGVPAGGGGAELRVLVIDDQSTMRRIVRQLLAANGIRNVLEASDGSEGLEQLLRPGQPWVDLVICDLLMPGMDGLAFCNKVRREPALRDRHLPVLLLLTAMTDELVLQVARQVGAVDIANKPIAAPELGRRIEKLVGIKLH